jgi:hypothetical protein
LNRRPGDREISAPIDFGAYGEAQEKKNRSQDFRRSYEVLRSVLLLLCFGRVAANEVDAVML